MGSETSKPVEPPADWYGGDEQRHNQFQIISPVSDVSCPSEMKRDHTHHNNHRPQYDGPTPTLDRRRTSRVISSTVRATANSFERDVPAPSAFYFPTKDTEKYFERAAAAARAKPPNTTSTDNAASLRQRKTTNSNGNKENAPAAGGAGATLNRLQQLFGGCLAEQPSAAVEMEQQQQQQQQQQRSGSSMAKNKNHSKAEGAPLQVKAGAAKVSNSNSNKNPTVVVATKMSNRPTNDNSSGNKMTKDTAQAKQKQLPSGSANSQGRRISEFDAGKQKQKQKQSTKQKKQMEMLEEVPPRRRGDQNDTGERRKSDVRTKKEEQGQETKSKRASDPGAVRISKSADHPPSVDENNRGNIQQQLLPNSRQQFVLRESDGMMMPDSFHMPTPSRVLHQEDAYFARLVAENSNMSEAVPSPMHQATISPMSSLTHDYALRLVKVINVVKDSPVTGNNLFKREPPSPLLGDKDADDSMTSIYTSGSMDENEMKQFHSESVLPSTSGVVTRDSTSAAGVSGSIVSKEEGKRRISGSALTERNYATDEHGSTEQAVQHLLELQSEEDEEEKSLEVYLDENSESMEEPAAEDQSASRGTTLTLDSLVKLSLALGREGPVNVDDISPTSIDSGMNTYFKPREEAAKNASSAFQSSVDLPEDPLKQIATLRPNSNGIRVAKMSKLESLFRPVLPALSFDDAESITSYDRYEIKVTESAPGVIESKDYRAIAWNPHLASPANERATKLGTMELFSPSMVSIDSQMQSTPSSTNKHMVSNQALCNASFLFSHQYAGKFLEQPQKKTDRDSGMFSISTVGARSRISQRSTRERAVTIPVSGVDSVTTMEASKRSTDGRRVHFVDDSESNGFLKRTSVESRTIVVPAIERKVSDLTDTMSDIGSRPSIESIKLQSKYEVILEEPKQTESICEISQASRSTRVSFASVAESEKTPDSPSTCPSIHWTYRGEEGDMNAVTPFVKGKQSNGKSITNPTNSPFIRFKAAKNKFTDPAPVKEATVKKATPTKAKKVKKAKRKSTGGIVSARVDHINKRVKDLRKLRRKRHSSAGDVKKSSRVSNPPMIRNPVTWNYKPNATGFELFSLPSSEESSILSEESDDLSPAKTGARESIDSIPRSSVNRIVEEYEEDDDDDDDATGFSESEATVETLRRDPTPILFENTSTVLNARFSRTRAGSETSYSTASSGLTTVRKDVFRNRSSITGSRRSASSEGGSTTLSSIMGNENSTYLPFRMGTNTVKPTEQRQHRTAPESLYLSPTQRTPMQARKWRALAAAAQEKDSKTKGKAFGKGIGPDKPKKGLSERNSNQQSLTYI
jgi:hypothetical protein